MLNEKKIKLMTKIAIYEKNEGREMGIAAKSFKVDYVTLQMLYTAVATTIGYVCLIALYVLGHLEELLIDAASVDFPQLLEHIIQYYVMILILFLIVALIFYSRKYDKSFDKVKRNYTDLKNLAKLIEK